MSQISSKPHRNFAELKQRQSALLAGVRLSVPADVPTELTDGEFQSIDSGVNGDLNLPGDCKDDRGGRKLLITVTK